MGITFHQERKTERALEALRELASPRAQVLRDAKWQSIAAREMVVGDLIRIRRIGLPPRVCSVPTIWSPTNRCLPAIGSVHKRASDVPTAWAARWRRHRLPTQERCTPVRASRVCATGVQTEIGKIGELCRPSCRNQALSA